MVPLLGAPFRPYGSTAETHHFFQAFSSPLLFPLRPNLSLSPPPSLTIGDLSRDHARPLVLLLLFLFLSSAGQAFVFKIHMHVQTGTCTPSPTPWHTHTHARARAHTHTCTHIESQWSFGRPPRNPSLLLAVEC